MWTDFVGPAHGRVVTFRADSIGGGARTSPMVGEGFSRRRRLVILVHGFNVSEKAAYAAYRALEHNLAKALGNRRWEAFSGEVLWLLWPGDARLLEGFSPFAAVRPGIYGPRVAHVQEWAPNLGAWLARQRGPAGGNCELVLVGHSLGCRVILEALRTMPTSTVGRTNPISLLMLMAAAVPVAHLEPGGRLRVAAERARRRDVLHSTVDTVLQVAFRVGQLFGETFVGGIAPEAVGLRGAPGPPVWTSDKPMWVKHSGYWGNPVVARRLLHQLGMVTSSGPVEREFPERQSSQSRRSLARKVLRPWRRISSRKVR